MAAPKIHAKARASVVTIGVADARVVEVALGMVLMTEPLSNGIVRPLAEQNSDG